MLFFITQGNAQIAAVKKLYGGTFYIGVPNLIRVVVEKCSCKDIRVRTDTAMVYSVAPGHEPCEYEIMAKRPGELSIVVDVRKGNTFRAIDTEKFRVEWIPDPVAKVAGRSMGNIPRNIMRAQMGVFAVLEAVDGFCFDARFVVTGFSVIILHNGKAVYSKTMTGARFDDDISNHFGMLEDGDIVVFANITAKGYDARIRNLQPIQLTVDAP